MRIGVVFPQTEIGADVGAVRAYAERVEELGYTHVLAYDHVLGADTSVHRGWRGPYDLHSTFHEPLVLFGFGVGLGWNPVEYEALGKSFSDRGRRMGEQVFLFSDTATTESVTFDGRY